MDLRPLSLCFSCGLVWPSSECALSIKTLFTLQEPTHMLLPP